MLVTSDGSIWRSVYMHIVHRHYCAVGLILKWKPCKAQWYLYAKTAIRLGTKLITVTCTDDDRSWNVMELIEHTQIN